MSAIAILGSGVSAAAAGVGTSCKLTAAVPTMANNHVTSKGSVRCQTSRTVNVQVETQVRQLGQWGTFGSFDNPSVQVQAAKTRHVSTRPANCAGLGTVTMRTVVRLLQFSAHSHRVLASVRSRSVAISCSGHGQPSSKVSCDPQPQSPVSTSGHITASGTVRCSAQAKLSIDLQLQVYFNGSWQEQAFAMRTNFDAAANTTYSFTTSPPTPCSAPQPGAPPPPPEQYRAQMMVSSGQAPITKTSPVVVLTTC
jgi:hypothetical protein